MDGATRTSYDAIVLDVMLPGIDGFETCRQLRDDGVWTPVLMLTARDSVEDRVAGLDTRRRRLPGQAVRVRRAARPPACARPPRRARAADACSRSATFGSTRRPARCWRGDAEIGSRPRSSRCSRPSCAGPARCSSRLQLLEHAWDFAYENRSNVVDVYVRHLRGRSTSRSAAARSRRCAASGYRLRPDGAVSRLPIRLRVTAAFAVAMAAGARRLGLVPLRPARLAPRDSRSTATSTSRRKTSPRSFASRPRRWRATRAAASSSEARATRSCSIATGACSTRRGRSAQRRFSTRPSFAPPRRRAALHRRESVPGLDEPSRLLASPVARAGAPTRAPRRRDRQDNTRRSPLPRRAARSPARSPCCSHRSPATSLAGLSFARSSRCVAVPPRSRPTTPGERLPVPRDGDELERLGETLNEMLERLEDALERERELRRRRRARAAHAARAPAHRARARAPTRRVAG